MENVKWKIENVKWNFVKLLAALHFTLYILHLHGAAVQVQGARKDALYNDDFVVTNVTVALDDLVTTNQLEGAANAVKTELKGEIAGATNAVAAELIGKIAGATNAVAAELIGKIAGATNAVAGERAAALAPYATKDWVAAQGYASDSALEGYATQGWVTEQGYAPKSWVEGRGYMTGTNLAPYATKEWVEGRGYTTGTNLAPYATRTWVEGRGYTTGTNLAPYATKEWVEGKGYVTAGEARERIENGAGEAVKRIAAEMDGTTAHRLMAPGECEWIDGTGTIWRVYSTVEWHGVTLTGYFGTTNWIGEGWSIWWEPEEESAELGTWRMRNVLTYEGPLEVEWRGEDLPYGEGQWRLVADKVELNGTKVTPGLIAENGWYQIADQNGNRYYVSPLVTTVTVARVTNVVDRLARLEELSPPTSLAPATNYTDEAISSISNALASGDLEVAQANSAFYAERIEDTYNQTIRTGTTLFAQIDSKTSTNDVCAIVTNQIPLDPSDWNYPEKLGDYWYSPDTMWVYEYGDTNKNYYTIELEYSPNTERWNLIEFIVVFYEVEDGVFDWIDSAAIETNIQAPEDTLSLTIPLAPDFGGGSVVITRKSINALGLARLIDLPPLTNGLISAATATNIVNDLTDGYLATTGGVVNGSVDFNGDFYNFIGKIKAYDEISISEDGLFIGDKAIGTYTEEKSASTTSNIVTKAYVESLGIESGISAETATNIASTVSSSAIASADTTYRRTIGLTNLNQSVQYVNITDTAPTTLAISMPTDGATKDWMVYVVSVTNVTISLPAATWWMADVAYTNDVPPATPTAFYFSQITDGVFFLGRQELSPVTITEGN